MAGFLPGPGNVLSFTEALYSELKPLGIRVAVLCPGLVPTEFAERAGISGGRLGPSILTQSTDCVAEVA
jgi:uncharacterized protein